MTTRMTIAATTILGLVHDLLLDIVEGTADEVVAEPTDGRTIFDRLDDVTRTATDPGNAFANEYLLGMANGLLLAQAIVHEEEPAYLTMPDKPINGERGFAPGSRASADMAGCNTKAPAPEVDYRALEAEREAFHRRQQELETLRALRNAAMQFATAHTIHGGGSINDTMDHASRIEQFLLIGSASNGAKAN